MKNLLIGLALVFSGLSVFAQAPTNQFNQIISAESSTANYSVNGSILNATASVPSASALGDTLFHETFGNGLLGDGSNGAWNANGVPSAALWTYRGTSTTPDITTGSQGAFVAGFGPITSSTTTNGFMIFDSDYYDNNGISTNLGFGSVPSPHTGYLVSPSMNLTNYPNVVIELTSFYRKFNSQCLIEFSINGGSTWPYSIKLYGDQTALHNIAVNYATTTAHKTETLIPIGVGGNSNVKFRLTFDGTDVLGNPNGAGYYFWMVDDILIKESPDNDLTTTQLYFNGVADSNSAVYTYSSIPERQANQTNMLLGSTMYNNGSTAAYNVKSNIKVTSPTTTNTITSSSSITSVSVGGYDSINAGTYSPNDGVGNYLLEFYPSSDSIDEAPLNDTINYAFQVTSNIYAWADTGSIGYRPQNVTSNYEICSFFEIHVNDTAIGISAQFNHNANDPNDPDNLVAGSDFLEFRVLDADSFNPVNAYIGSNVAAYTFNGSPFYAIQSSDLGNEIYAPLTHGATTPTLTPGNYYACVKSYNPNAFISSDDSKSNDFWRSGTTIIDTDNDNDWGGFMVTPTIKLYTKGGNVCDTVNILPSIVKDESTQTNGSYIATASGGTPPYNFGWTLPNGNTINNDSLTGLSQNGIYKLVVSDYYGCTSPVLVDTMAGCVGLSNMVINYNVTHATGPVNFDGAIDITVTGGSGNVNYNWVGPNGFMATTEDISSIETGLYSVLVSDLQCPILNTLQNIFVADTGSTSGCAGVNITSTFTTDETSQTNGSITASATGGTAPYTYNWTYPNGNSNTGSFISGLNQAGLYSLIITDANGCQSNTLTVTLGGCVGLSNISLSGIVTNSSGAGISDGAINLSVSGGSGNYIYSWTGPNGFTATTQDINSIPAGTYTISIYDSQCAAISSSISFVVINGTSSGCAGVTILATIQKDETSQSNGSITATASGGTAPYIFNWTLPDGSVQSGSPLTGLNQAGNYSLTITDANGCTGIFSPITLGGCVGLSDITATTTVTDVSVPGLADGSIDLNANGGSGNYSFNWYSSNGYSSTIEDPSGLAVGFYFVTITDAQCPSITTVENAFVSNFSPCNNVVISASIVEDETSQTNGSITANASGGTAPYTYNWTYPNGFNQTGSSITGLNLAGDYQLLITDANGCLSTIFTNNLGGCVGLSDISIFTLPLNVSTSGASDGAINTTISGGSGQFQYSWLGPNGFSSNTLNISGLEIGAYTLSIYDSLCPALNTSENAYINVTSVENRLNNVVINVYPNPNNGSFTIETKGIERNASLNIKNVVGQSIYQSSLTEQQNQIIQLNQPIPGVYFVEVIEDKGETHLFKIIIR